jgi:hypothetical protein
MAKRTTKKDPTALNAGGIVVSRPSPNRRVVLKTNENTQTIYANNAVVEASTWDVKIRLGLIASGNDEEIQIMDVAHVYMTHEHAKAFLAVLAKGIQNIDMVRASQTNADKKIN